MKNYRLTLRSAAIAAVAGFIAVLVSGPQARAEEPGKADSADFARGAKSWADNCDRCHNMRDPKDFRNDQWKVIMSHMRIRAGLTGQESRDILKFLQGSN